MTRLASLVLLGLAVASGLGLAFLAGTFDGLLNRSRTVTESGDSNAADTGDAPVPAIPARAPNVDQDGATAHPSATIVDVAFENNQEAVEALETGDVDRAIDLLQESVALSPDVDVYAANLAESHLRRAAGRLDADDALGAVEDYDAALELIEPGDRHDRVRAKRDQARAIADHEADFVIESTLHFTFRYDGARGEVIAGIEALKESNFLEDTYQDYGDWFGHRPVEAGEPKIAIVLYRSEGFNAVTGLGDWAGGVFDGTIRVPADDLRSARSVARIKDVLRHEIAHAFTQSVGGADVPSWLNEGIAQWLENPTRRSVSVQLARGRLGASGESLFPLSELQGTLARWSDREKIARAYDQALAFTDYLIQQYGRDLVFEMVGAEAGAAQHFESRLLIPLATVLEDFGRTL